MFLCWNVSDEEVTIDSKIDCDFHSFLDAQIHELELSWVCVVDEVESMLMY